MDDFKIRKQFVRKTMYGATIVDDYCHFIEAKWRYDENFFVTDLALIITYRIIKDTGVGIDKIMTDMRGYAGHENVIRYLTKYLHAETTRREYLGRTIESLRRVLNHQKMVIAEQSKRLEENKVVLAKYRGPQ